ncbi:MAG: guanylate kinase [Candidatus Omnitrophota bacterium]|nr:guanylate kinase [Candidatus Omnitrophota bacterium]
MTPKIFIISGPGGSGKTTLLDALFRRKIFKKNFIRTISMTTRPRRSGERNGKDYFFTTHEDFLARKRKGFFLESQKVLANYYGTPKFFYAQAIAENKSLILCIDVKGGMYLKKSPRVGTINTIFITAPTDKELYRRLAGRAESKEFIKRRLVLAKEELKYARYYDYVVVNSTVKTALVDLEKVLCASQEEER